MQETFTNICLMCALERHQRKTGIDSEMDMSALMLLLVFALFDAFVVFYQQQANVLTCIGVYRNTRY